MTIYSLVDTVSSDFVSKKNESALSFLIEVMEEGDAETCRIYEDMPSTGLIYRLVRGNALESACFVAFL
jgi:hypothetical protein